MAEGKLHIEAGSFAYGCDMMLGIENLDFRISRNISCGYLARTCNVDSYGLRSVAEELCGDTLNVKNDVCYVLFNAGDCGDLVKNSVDLDACYGNSGKVPL